MSDLVERSDVIKMINRLIKDKDKCIVKSESFREGMVDGYCRVRNEMQYVPSIESSWIPVSDKHDNLPKGEVLACDEYGEMMFGYLSEEDGEVICENGGMVMCDVAAWMRKPNLFRGDENG